MDRMDDEFLERENKRLEKDLTWQKRVNLRLLLPTVGSVIIGAMLTAYLLGNYDFFKIKASIVAGMAAFAFVTLVYARREISLGRHFSEAVSAPLIAGFLVDVVVKNLYPNTTMFFVEASILIYSAAVVGLVFVTTEVALEYFIGAITGVALGNLFTNYASSIVVPLAVSGLIFPHILKKYPGGFIEGPMLGAFWALASAQQWTKKVTFFSMPTLVILATLIMLRILFIGTPSKQEKKILLVLMVLCLEIYVARFYFGYL